MVTKCHQYCKVLAMVTTECFCLSGGQVSAPAATHCCSTPFAQLLQSPHLQSSLPEPSGERSGPWITGPDSEKVDGVLPASLAGELGCLVLRGGGG